jgi:predicted oxidoreductase
LDYCRLKEITIQTWSPFQGITKGVFVGDKEKYPKINEKLDEIAEHYGVTPTAIATAWILRHPAHMQVVAGTTKVSRMQEILAGSNIRLTRAEWYDLYLSVGHSMP